MNAAPAANADTVIVDSPPYARRAIADAPAMTGRSVLTALLAIAVAALFIYAGYAKIVDPRGFVNDLRNYKLFPWWTLNAMALLAPWWEVLAAAALLVPAWRRAGATMTGLMGVIFFVSVSQALYRGLDISCGCFGHGDKAARAGLQTLAIDLFIIAASFYIFRSSPPATPRENGAA